MIREIVSLGRKGEDGEDGEVVLVPQRKESEGTD
jgi:hypothetical protein